MTEESNTIDNLLEKTDLQFMLEFETQIFLETIHNDGLVVASKGINLDLVLLNIFKVYSDPGNLVLVLNATENEEKYFKRKMNDPNVHSITFETNIKERLDMYLSGGISFVTTRILVVDMLKKRLPIEKITGFIVLRAHSIFESCQEAFVIRLYRQNNKTGFVKGFSNDIQSFTVGYGHVEKVMRALFVKELYIWPRFHSAVISSFKKYQPNVIELHIPISEKMKKMQTHILDLMNLTVKELKNMNKGVELQEITVENCLTKKFHKILQAQLDVIWNQLSRRSLQLVADLKTLRHIMLIMLHSDAVTFYSLIAKYRTMEYAQTATWVLLEPAELLFTQVNSFVFNNNKEFQPEFCPKWEPLLEILKVEVPAQVKNAGIKENTILILCSDYRSCHQLKEVLTNGPNFYLFMKALKNKVPIKTISKTFRNTDRIPENIEIPVEKKVVITKKKKLKTEAKSEESTETESKKEDEETDELEDFQNSYLLTMSQTICNVSKDDSDLDESTFTFEPFTQVFISQNCTGWSKNIALLLVEVLLCFKLFL